MVQTHTWTKLYAYSYSFYKPVYIWRRSIWQKIKIKTRARGGGQGGRESAQLEEARKSGRSRTGGSQGERGILPPEEHLGKESEIVRTRGSEE